MNKDQIQKKTLALLLAVLSAKILNFVVEYSWG